MRNPDRKPASLSRRQFVVTALTATGGFALGVAVPGGGEAAVLGTQPGARRPRRRARSTPGS